MLKIAIVGCGRQAATIAGYMGIYGDAYEVIAVVDTNPTYAKVMLAEKKVVLSTDCHWYGDVNDLVAKEKNLSGIIIGTPCSLHTEMACRLEPLGVPMHLEKPVAITFAEMHRLYHTFVNSCTPVQVSLPMRVCSLTVEVKKIIDSGQIGAVEQIIGYEDVGGVGYFTSWYRDFAKTGGMFLQKAVHDLDYMLYLAGSRPREICAMRAQRVFGGDKPIDLTCAKCTEQQSCPESPYNKFHQRGEGHSVAENMPAADQKCCFSKGLTIDDMGECIIELENGAQVGHHQNFFTGHKSHRRGAYLYGYRGTIKMDFSIGPNRAGITVMMHQRDQTETIEVPWGNLNHYGGDQVLAYELLKTMKTGRRSCTDLIHGAGMDSTLCCLGARESATKRAFVKIQDCLR